MQHPVQLPVSAHWHETGHQSSGFLLPLCLVFTNLFFLSDSLSAICHTVCCSVSVCVLTVKNNIHESLETGKHADNKQASRGSRFWTVHLCHLSGFLRFLISWTGSLPVTYKMTKSLIPADQSFPVLFTTQMCNCCIFSSFSEHHVINKHCKNLLKQYIL